MNLNHPAHPGNGSRPVRPVRQYDETFKRDAPRLLEQPGRPRGHPSAGHFKKGHGHRQLGAEGRFEMIRVMQDGQERYSMEELCEALGVSRNGYYPHLHKPERAPPGG